MEIKTKLNIGQDAWFIRENTVIKGQVKQIFVHVGDSVIVTYVVDKRHNMDECELFASKEDLLKSL